MDELWNVYVNGVRLARVRGDCIAIYNITRAHRDSCDRVEVISAAHESGGRIDEIPAREASGAVMSCLTCVWNLDEGRVYLCGKHALVSA